MWWKRSNRLFPGVIAEYPVYSFNLCLFQKSFGQAHMIFEIFSHSLVIINYISFTNPNCSGIPQRLRSEYHPHPAFYRDR